MEKQCLSSGVIMALLFRLVTARGHRTSVTGCLLYTSRRMIVSPHREGGQAQFIAQPVPKNTRDARINCLLDYLQQQDVYKRQARTCSNVFMTWSRRISACSSN